MRVSIIKVNFEVADFKNSRAAVDFIGSVRYCLAWIINSANSANSAICMVYEY